ncbi:MAG: hypothetical protein ACK5O6_03625, partial [Betaproteobacteria bacterium]
MKTESMRIFLRSTITFAEKMTIRLVYISLMMASSVLPASLAAASEPPARLVPPVRTVTETHFGVEVADPYRYMEDVANPEVIHFMRGESAYARSIIVAIPGRAQVDSRSKDLSQATTTVFGVQRTG